MPVAPHWGAWIEIAQYPDELVFFESHPTGVRGLKCKFVVESVADFSRTPLGCVD